MKSLLNELNWSAGVLESKAMFKLRVSPDGSVIGADVLCYCPLEIAKVLLRTVGGVYLHKKSLWVLRAPEQENGITRVLPHVRSKDVRRRMSRVLLFRATQVGGKISKEVKEFRKGLKDENT